MAESVRDARLGPDPEVARDDLHDGVERNRSGKTPTAPPATPALCGSALSLGAAATGEPIGDALGSFDGQRILILSIKQRPRSSGQREQQADQERGGKEDEHR